MESRLPDLAPTGATAGIEHRDATREPPPAAPIEARRELDPIPFPPDDLAARFFAKLGVLARFGLAAHTRLLLETSRRDG